MKRGLGDPCGSRQGARGPLGAADGWLGLQRPVDHLGHLVVIIGAGPARTQFVMQTLDAQIEVALPPFAYGRDAVCKSLGDSGVGVTGRAGQHNLRPLNDRMRQGPRSSQARSWIALRDMGCLVFVNRSMVRARAARKSRIIKTFFSISHSCIGSALIREPD